MQLSPPEIKELKERSRKLRVETFDLSRKHGGYHFGGSLSAIEILVSLYKKILKPEDRFILSKGHAAFAWYPLLREQGYNPTISGHPDMDIKNGICCTTGSLGMGLPTGMGMAFKRKKLGEKGHIYVLMGEAECQEGTTWEASLFNSQHKLDNLTCIIDRNKYQGSGDVNEIISLGDLEKKFQVFGSQVHNIDGHSFEDLITAFNHPVEGKSKVIIANTIKGKGVSFMEADPGSWHGKFPNPSQMRQVYQDLGGEYRDIKCEVSFDQSRDLRKPFVETLVELAEKDERIWLLSGDYESNLAPFKKRFPNRYTNMGTMEQSMISVAAGMAIDGVCPVVYTITPFFLARAKEQIDIGIDQQNIPVMLVGFDDYPHAGPTHNSLNPEGTAALFRNIKSYFPKTVQETKEAVREAYQTKGPSFIRLQREKIN